MSNAIADMDCESIKLYLFNAVLGLLAQKREL